MRRRRRDRRSEPAAAATQASTSAPEASPASSPAAAEVIAVDYPHVLEDVVVDDRIVLGDGGISLRVTGAEPGCIVAAVESGGRLKGRAPACTSPASGRR